MYIKSLHKDMLQYLLFIYTIILWHHPLWIVVGAIFNNYMVVVSQACDCTIIFGITNFYSLLIFVWLFLYTEVNDFNKAID